MKGKTFAKCSFCQKLKQADQGCCLSFDLRTRFLKIEQCHALMPAKRWALYAEYYFSILRSGHVYVERSIVSSGPGSIKQQDRSLRIFIWLVAFFLFWFGVGFLFFVLFVLFCVFFCFLFFCTVLIIKL